MKRKWKGNELIIYLSTMVLIIAKTEEQNKLSSSCLHFA